MQEKKAITAYKKGLRTTILQAAMKAFAEKGIRAVKMDDIAESLAISKRTMYEIYTTKEELLYEGVFRHKNVAAYRLEQGTAARRNSWNWARKKT